MSLKKPIISFLLFVFCGPFSVFLHQGEISASCPVPAWKVSQVKEEREMGLTETKLWAACNTGKVGGNMKDMRTCVMVHTFQ